MAEERDRARLVSAYADELIERRVAERPGAEAGAEADLTRMLELTHSLSEIELEAPPNLTSQLWEQARQSGAFDEPPRASRGPWRPLLTVGAVLRKLASWPVRHPAVAATTIGAALLAFLGTRGPSVSAAELLRVSSRAESARLERPGFVAHRAFTLETRRLPEAQLVSRRRVELWHNPKARIKARRVFDEGQRLLGGEWTNPDGSRVLYEPGKPPRKERASDPKPVTHDAIWRWEPAAADFSELAGGVDRMRARATDAGFEISFDDASGRVAQAELALDKEHLPVAQRVVLRDGGEAVEVLTERTVAEELPEAQVAQGRFEPEPELLPSPAASPAGPAVPAPVLSTLALDGMELQASYRLHRLGDCLAQPGELHRDSNAFRIRVFLASEACREEAQRGFASLGETPGVALEMSVSQQPVGAAERPQRDAASSASESLDSDQALASMPAYRALYDFYSRRALSDPSSGGDVDAVVNPLIRKLAVWTREASSRIVAHARELERLRARWPPQTLKPLGLDAASTWQSMVRDNARSLAQNTDLLVAQIEPAFGVAPPQEELVVPTLRNVTDVRRAIGELRVVVESNDGALRALLSAAKKAEATPPAEPARLAQELRRASRLAARFTEPWSLDP